VFGIWGSFFGGTILIILKKYGVSEFSEADKRLALGERSYWRSRRNCRLVISRGEADFRNKRLLELLKKMDMFFRDF